MIDPLTAYRAGLRCLADACLLHIVGRFGTAGLPGKLAGEALKMAPSSWLQSFGRLERAGLVLRHSRDSHQGRPNRYVIAPAGLALLQSKETIDLPPQQVDMMLAGKGEACI